MESSFSYVDIFYLKAWSCDVEENQDKMISPLMKLEVESRKITAANLATNLATTEKPVSLPSPAYQQQACQQQACQQQACQQQPVSTSRTARTGEVRSNYVTKSTSQSARTEEDRRNDVTRNGLPHFHAD